MDTKYERKFEEMKKYIPFLESMIKRLENSRTESNPRQAQLDKIRTLRDLLLGKKKRMNMENLFKCEDALIKLYAKVQQRDPGPKDEALDMKATEKSNLKLGSKKFKNVVLKLESAGEKTLPEIERNKKPALFQCRPNMPSTVSSPFSPTRNKESKHNYTRVLQSPKTRSHKRWTNTEKISDKPHFCRRSPKISTRIVSPTYYKKKRKKLNNKSKDKISKDLYVTPNVPEESLSSLNTKDILSRITNCSDNDVDIDTLQELRTQILGELKDTEAKDDISDIILKSYKNTGKKSLKNKEIEEGELSDCKSEAIESINGSLVIMDKEKPTSETNVKPSDTEKPRRINIYLVITPTKNESISQEENCKSIDNSELETHTNKENNSNQTELVNETKEVTEQTPIKCNIVKNTNFQADLEKNDKNINTLPPKGQAEISYVEQENENTIQFPFKTDIVDAPEETNTFSEKNLKPNLCTSTQDHNKENKIDTSRNKKDTSPDVKTISEVDNDSNVADKNIKSEFKSKLDNQNEKSNIKCISTLNSSTEKNNTVINNGLDVLKQKPNPENPTSCDKEQKPNDDIPLLVAAENVSEIDILQALKNEILNETTSVLGPESITPPLHQPKITKVVDAQEIGTKKRISIKNYNAKPKKSNDNTSNMEKDYVTRKQSLVLSKLSYVESSEVEDLSNMSLDNTYCNLAPKSPDHEDFADTGLKPPLIISSNPVKTTVVSSEAEAISTEKELIKGDKRLLDPRIKRETSCVPEILNPYLINTNNMQKAYGITYNRSTLNLNKFQNINANSSSISNPNATPTRVSMISPNLPTYTPQLMPNLTPNMTTITTTNMALSMTPNARTYDLTPWQQAFENYDFSSQKHVYTQIFQTYESRDYNDNKRHQWDKHDKNQPFWGDVDIRNSSVQRDINYIDPSNNSIQRDNKMFEQYQIGSRNDRFIKDSIPSHSFVRLECPASPNVSFGRLDCPSTPAPKARTYDLTSSRQVFENDDFSSQKHVYTPICQTYESRDYNENKRHRWEKHDKNQPFWDNVDIRGSSVQRNINYRDPRSNSIQRDNKTLVQYQMGSRNDGFIKDSTPSHSFMRLECPATPNASYGRLDYPSTPTPSFGKIDCPMTPIPSFGRSECPPTPNHLFGRYDSFHGTPFIRPDFSQAATNQNYGNTQVTRGSESDNYYARDEDREQNYFQNRNINKDLYKTKKSNCHSSSDHYRKFQREKSVGRNERNKNYEKNVRNYKEFNRVYSFNREYKSDRTNFKNRGSSARNYENRHQNEFKKYDDYDRRNFQRGRSIGKKESTRERFSRPRNRDPSEGITFHADSFKIDTGVNRTFQSTEKIVVVSKNSSSSSSFDAVRQRAASVGRTLINDCRKDNDTKNIIITSTKKEQNFKFRRACSVGREIKYSKLDFKDIKEDLRSFKLKENIMFSKGHERTVDSNKVTEFKKTYEVQHSNEAIISTSGDDNSREKNVLDKVGVLVLTKSTPDSTINSCEICEDFDSQKSAPDSTNGSQCKMNSYIASTHNTTETRNMELLESSSSHTASAEIEKFGKLLSILQDKSKIKEILGLLGDNSSENVKIKQNLKKLSEIASDDEDTMSENNSEKINDVKNNSCNIEIVVDENSRFDINVNERNTTNTANSKERLVNLNEDSKNTKQENDRSTSEIITDDSPKNAACDDHDYAKKSNTNGTEILEPQEMATGRRKTKKRNYKFNTAKKLKNKTTTKPVLTKEKHLTRSDVANLRYEKSARKKPTELQKLQDDIREMFLNKNGDILSTGATGIRMCRLAKLVDKTRNQNDDQTETGSNSSQSSNQKPVVVLEKLKDFKCSTEISQIDTSKKKCTMKGKRTLLECDSSLDTEDKLNKRSKPNKSSTNVKINFKTKAKMKKNAEDIDPYTFDNYLTNHLENTNNLENDIKSFESESEFAVSLKHFGSMELLTEAKKKIKRKLVSKGRKAGIIKPKNRKKKVGGKKFSKSSSCEVIESQSVTKVPVNCFTDKTKGFVKTQSCYDCRLCSYRGKEIVAHYKKQHLHSEISLSQMSSAVAIDDTSDIKIKQEVNECQDIPRISNDLQIDKDNQETSSKDQVEEEKASNDIFDYPHFKIKYTDTGSKEYVCCIKGNFHYKTHLLISLKKHVQLKHSEVWDGFCFTCKVIVTPQGVYHFKDCLQHFLDTHDNFPIFEEVISEPNAPNNESFNICNENLTALTTYIKVRPQSDLISHTLHSSEPTVENRSASPMTITDMVISLGSEIEQYKYKELQAEIISESKKHRVVLDAMMFNYKLVHVFKCASRFCHFTTDSAEDAQVHLSVHTRVGGVDSLNCVYCDYDASNNAIDLINHVFNIHGRCQYACNLCFYRASTAKLVDAHIKRVHEKQTNRQILYTSFHTGPSTEDHILSQEEAVQFYVCTVGRGTDAPCKYRTYLPGRYFDHFRLKHDSETEFSCCTCPTKLSTAHDLVMHMKNHGLKLNQCARCIYGSDNTDGLLAHAYSNHPGKIVKAYLRKPTERVGTTDLTDLPLVILRESEIDLVEVARHNFKENPVRAAETCINLEKIISPTDRMIESTSNVEENEPSSNLKDDLQSSVQEDLSTEESSEILLRFKKSEVTPPPLCEKINKSEIISTPVIKSEKEESAADNASQKHKKIEHSVISVSQPKTDTHVKKLTVPKGRKRSLGSKQKVAEPLEKLKKFEPHEIHLLPINPILDDSVFCSLCEFNTKVRHNMVRHLQLHAEQQSVPQTAPVNSVPHLETNEKHCDKIVNLASSSIVPGTDKSKADYTFATVNISPEAASRYPKHVAKKHRLTCGAKGCSYISVYESMLKRHWKTLHTGTNFFHCVHCSPHQHLDTTTPLTASRVIDHLKMHDSNLYACSLCSYYHYRRQFLENHLNDVHREGQVIIVREENSTVRASPVQTSAVAPTMDVKPWQCGLCKYKSLLRPEVVDHCAKTHNSKMQYKCAYCAFRTSNSVNITKHQSRSHVGKQEEIFYYYYQEGSVPDDQDGMPRWQKQKQKFVDSVMPETPSPDKSLILPIISQIVSLRQTEAPANQEIDLNLIKKEAMEATPDTIENLCKEFGEFCEPNGLKYKCPLCKNTEDTIEAMQSHLYEELKYRKWGCSICSYKAFHKTGLNEHMQIEHRQNREPVSLQADVQIESWVRQLLEHQTAHILKNKENFAKQKEVPGTSSKPPFVTDAPATAPISKKLSMSELEKTFGSFGASVNMSFCCPKCKVLFKEESAMVNHLEKELNKTRWFCSVCFATFQDESVALFHCISAHEGMSLRPVKADRDPLVRLSWIEAVIRVQKLNMNHVSLQKNISPETETLEIDKPENSLLVVRYEETVLTPEKQMEAVSTPITAPNSDAEILVIDEPKEPQKDPKNCHICTKFHSVNSRAMRNHILRHYNLKPLLCGYCNLTITRRSLEKHQREHPYLPPLYSDVEIPFESPGDYLAKQRLNIINQVNKVICMECQNLFGEAEVKTHRHNNVPATFGKKGDVVTKCSFCLTLHKDVNAYNDHHQSHHESKPKNFEFVYLEAIQSESNYQLSYTIVPKHKPKREGTTNKRIGDVDPLLPNNKKARKTTTKLPLTKTYVRKSTTKLPSEVPD